MGMGGPSMFDLQKIYWAFVGTVISVAFVANIINRLLAAHRLSAKPEGTFFSAYATITALSREVANASISPPFLGKRSCSSVTLGKTILVIANLVLVLILCFYNLNTKDQWQWENVGYQTGFITAAQLPLVILLAGKRNIIGFLIGSSYERLSWLHRWVSRTLFLTATIHMAFWFKSWDRYDYIGKKLSTDKISQRGLAAWSILLWIFLSSFAPIRRWNYELFVVQHILTFIGFLAAVFLHLPAEVKAWIWIPIALYIFDRALRSVLILYSNCNLFKSGKQGLVTCQAEIEDAGAGLSRVTIKDPPISWSPGQHVFLQCHGVAPLQSHPFTVASLPEDRRMEFLMKSRTGATKRFLSHAQKSLHLPSASRGAHLKSYAAIIDGPYGYLRTLRQFDSVTLIAGGCGATFTMPLMRDIVNGWKRPTLAPFFKQLLKAHGSVTRHIRLVWVVKSRDELSWFSSQISQAWDDTQEVRKFKPDIRLEISVYVTCDTDLSLTSCAKTPSSGIELRDMQKIIASSDTSTSPSEKPKADQDSLKSDSSTSSERSELLKGGYGKDGKCCCTTVIVDEGTDQTLEPSSQVICRCNEVDSSSASDVQSQNRKGLEQTFSGEQLPVLQSHDLPFKTFSGRPDCKNVIRTMLERAQGESAVVVCGPPGLNNNVRESVVALSDERAVCKGSGAHGIYFWEEGFSY